MLVVVVRVLRVCVFFLVFDVFFVLCLVSIYMVSGVGVCSPWDRVCLGYPCFCCVGRDRLGLGVRVFLLAWGD